MTTAAALIADLEAMARPEAIPTVARFFAGKDTGTIILGVPIGSIFPVAKRYKALPLAEINHLLDDNRYEVRMAGISVMDFQAREKKISDADRKALFDLYLARHDRINNWDLVDRAAPYVVGEYLLNRGRSVLEDLAGSGDPHRRRTAIVATYAFLRRKDTEWTFHVADLLAGDADIYVQKAIASWTREAGKTAPDALKAFLAKNADILPRTTVREASKGLPAK
jgi:3-methyladenine DNA glycosylase AlkD